MSLINKEIADFSAQAFIKAAGAEKGKFKTITKADLLDKWSVLFFYPADFTFVCPTELEDLANLYENFKTLAVKFTVSPVILILSTKHGMRIPLK